MIYLETNFVERIMVMFLQKVSLIIFTEKGREAKVRGDEIKREGLKSITNYDLFRNKLRGKDCDYVSTESLTYERNA